MERGCAHSFYGNRLLTEDFFGKYAARDAPVKAHIAHTLKARRDLNTVRYGQNQW